MFDFTPERRAMSIVVEDEGKIYAFVKGADSSLMKMRNKDHNNDSTKKLKEDIKSFASKGLRTLAFGMKEIQLQDGESLKDIL